MKTCTKCKVTKQLAEFRKDARRKDGLRSSCKACEKIAYDKYYAANPEALIAVGAKYYANNKLKVSAGIAKYRAKNTEKVATANAKWRAEHLEKIKADSAKWRCENPEKAAASGARYRAENQEKVNAKNTKWRTENAEAVRIYSHNRRARKRANGGLLSKGLAERLFKLQRGLCPCCNLPLGDDYHMDHIMPIALGGANEDWNMQLLRQRCNNQKHSKHPIDFMQSRGFLL